ncbi:Uncharacterized iron-regulated membrane protein [Tenacibaculum sp. MAR_2009_124]|uniref:PepSY-associated TM helix domain-containing protein n=1 Tax=Tenacibaculum sp. MAR_2009_124 TaxID=1250059 RepID=UPI000894FC41|nr:PepSY domain-containing protein [Tenacibaculum sp. MAR_2009_124]SEC31215.1 Uncharacterized iron-regulated membrane protein [Tenacibaculum sp. MAR_2009_124]
MKNRKLNQWLWKWHFIAGLISLPFVLVLSITGAIYLFKSEVEQGYKSNITKVVSSDVQELSYQEQWLIAKKEMKKPLSSIIVLNDNGLATEFVAGRFSHKTSIFVDANTGRVTGKFSPKNTWMYTVRKLHGELLGGSFGTKIIELIACWMIVLIITGLYVWWPFKRGVSGVFLPRFNEGKRTFYRDLHAVLGFWFSGLLVLTLAGGLPWTDVFGGGFKWIQKVTNTGYPKTWSGRGLTSQIEGDALTLDEMITIAKSQNLKGELSVGLPKSEKSTFCVFNKTFDLDAQRMLHFDQYSGSLVKKHTWSDVGVLMRARMWVMAFHQGQFGGWNFWIMFGVALVLTVMSISAIISYLLRKQKGTLGVPKVPKSFSVTPSILILIGVLGLLLPLFGLSVLLIWISSFFKRKAV